MNKLRIKKEPLKVHSDFEFVGIGGQLNNKDHDWCIFYCGGGPGRKRQPGEVYTNERFNWLNSPSRHFYKGKAPKSCYDFDWSFKNVLLTRFNEETMVEWYERS